MTCLRTLPHRMTKRVTITLCMSAVCFSVSCNAVNQNATELHASEPPRKSSAPRFVLHEALVKFKDGVSQERIATILKENHLAVIAEIQRGRLYHVRTLDNRSVTSVITQLSSFQEIEYAEPNYRYETQK